MDIPSNIKKAIDLYVKEGIEPGSFTRFVLENNLSGAVGHADIWSMEYLKEIVIYVYNEIPSNCWGSKREGTKLA